MAHTARSLPSQLQAPAFVDRWRSRALAFGAGFSVLAIILGFLAQDHWNHFLRGWLHGFMMCFGFWGGGFVLLMTQYLSGGKWGLIVRRPLEAMTRTLPLVMLLFLPVAIFGANMGKLYIYTRYADWATALKNHWITNEQAHAIHWKQPMLNLKAFWLVSLACFAIWALYTFLLNRWSLQRDADPEPNYVYWRTKFENLSGFGTLLYALLLFVCVIYWVMALDPTWYSTVYGFQFLVGQAYGVFGLAILTLIGLSKAEPIRSTFRVVEQHDLGKLCFAFTMLNMYLAFGAFLIIWSGNSPEEIPWYLDRLRGGWGVVATLDVMCHWLLPFSLLLSRDLKRLKGRLAVVCCIMIFARFLDLFWLIEPNFSDAKRNLHFSFGILEYIAVPGALVSFWLAFYFMNLKDRPVLATNDPHLVEILESEHVHA